MEAGWRIAKRLHMPLIQFEVPASPILMPHEMRPESGCEAFPPVIPNLARPVMGYSIPPALPRIPSARFRSSHTKSGGI